MRQRVPKSILAVLASIALVAGAEALSRAPAAEEAPSTRVRTAVAATAPTAPPVTPAPAAAPAAEPLPAGPAQEAAHRALTGKAACLVVRREGKTVVAHNPDTPFTTASTQKILVTAAALRLLGPDHRFRTAVKGAAPVNGIVGDLWLVGGGDPMLATPEYAAYLSSNPRWSKHPATHLTTLADRLVASGVREVHGWVHADQSRHESLRLLEDWRPQLLWGGNISPLTPLTLNGGWERWTPPRAALEDPAPTAAGQLIRLLRERGVLVLGEPTVSDAPTGMPQLATVDSAPLSHIVAGILAASDNLATELLVREIGLHHTGEGTSAAGLRATGEILAAAGVDTTGLNLRDGSGLSRGNRATCKTLAQTMELTAGHAQMRNLIAVAGRYGTVGGRFRGTPFEGRIKGKTGTISGVIGLTGEFGDGRSTYAMLQNDVGAPWEARALEEQLLLTVAYYLG